MYSDKNNNDETHISVDIQQDNARANNPSIPKLEDNIETNNMNMPQSNHDRGQKIIWTKSGWVRHRPHRLHIMEEY